MRNRIFGLFAASAALLLMTMDTTTAQQYALAVSRSGLYQVKLSGSTMSYKRIYDLGSSNWARSIATYGDQVLVTGVSSSGSTLSVLTLKDTGATVDKTISLSAVTYAGPIAVDSNNGIYIGDDSGSSARYAYLSSTSGAVQTNSISTDTTHAPLIGVAASGNTAVIISRHDSTVSDQSFITTLTDGSVVNTTSLEVGAEYPRYPVAVAARAGYAYVLSSYNTIPGSAALSRYSISGGTVDPPASLDDFVPTDITTFSLSGTDYLALIGRTSLGQLQAWKAILSGGSIGTWNKTILGTDGSVDFRCSVSSDGSTMWYSSSTGGYVGTMDTASWTKRASISVGDQISGLVGFTTGMPPVTIPEPSSLLALAGFGAGAIGLYSRRKLI
jgi:hypothetical protein